MVEKILSNIDLGDNPLSMNPIIGGALAQPSSDEILQEVPRDPWVPDMQSPAQQEQAFQHNHDTERVQDLPEEEPLLQEEQIQQRRQEIQEMLQNRIQEVQNRINENRQRTQEELKEQAERIIEQLPQEQRQNEDLITRIKRSVIDYILNSQNDQNGGDDGDDDPIRRYSQYWDIMKYLYGLLIQDDQEESKNQEQITPKQLELSRFKNEEQDFVQNYANYMEQQGIDVETQQKYIDKLSELKLNDLYEYQRFREAQLASQKFSIENRTPADNEQFQNWIENRPLPSICKRDRYTDSQGILRTRVICENRHYYDM